MSPIIAPVAGFIGICPDANKMFPDLIACEYEPMALGALSVLIISLDMFSLL